MFDVITIGTALVDIFIRSTQFQVEKVDESVMLCQHLGEKIEVDSFQVTTGGAASNTAVGFARLGFEVAAVAETGRDTFAKVVTEDLEREEVDTRFVIRERREQTGGSVILVGQDGGRTIMVHRGAASQLDVYDLPRQALLETGWWHLSSIAGRLPVLQHLFMLAKLHQKKVSWNPGKAELKLLAHKQLSVPEICCEVFILNKEEWQLVSELHEELKAQVPLIVVTDGARGGVVYHDNQQLEYEAHKVASVDDTGAGDAFATGFVAALLNGRDPVTAARWGVENASSVIKHVGAKPGLLTEAQLETILSTSPLF